MRRSRRWLWLALVGLVVVFLTLPVVAPTWNRWRNQADLDQAQRAEAQGRWAEAQACLARVVSRSPRHDEACYRLGVAEQALGHEDAARDAWERVRERSPFGGRAALELARIALRTHHLARAERWMERAILDKEPHAQEAFETLISLDRIEGRYDAAIALAREWADRFPSPIHIVRELTVLGSPVPHKLDQVRTSLATASRSAPDDDRVWLGWANLATRTGEFETAREWLARCEQKRPDDPAVIRAGLDLAMARDDVAGAWRALARGEVEGLGPAEILGLRAWFAAKAGDEAAERSALGHRLRIDPAHRPTLERLAELELRAGHAAEADRLRASMAELDAAKARFDLVLFGPDSAARAGELAALAEQLHRPVEARVLWTLANRQNPGAPEPPRALARLAAARPPEPPADASLAGLLATRPTQASFADHAPGDKAQPTTGSVPRFVDDAEAAGLRFRFDRGLDPNRHLPETMSGGLAVLDYDGDGWPDVYCVQGGPFPPDPGRPPEGDRLFRNRGDGTFEDATGRSGVAAMPRGYGHGVAVGDVDNDGFPDLFVTRWDAYALLHNNGDGTFADRTEAAGLSGPRDWPTSAAFADLDRDGDLDLYVCHYLEWDAANPQVCRDPKTNAPVFCGPPRFRARPDHLFRNDGGRFVDVSAEAGVSAADADGRGLGVVACDFDGDDDLDLFVANDQSANFLFLNEGNLRFREVAAKAGVATNADGQTKANMGVACGDVDGNGWPDLVVTEFYNEGSTLYSNLGRGLFADHSAAAGLQRATRTRLGFGVALLDHDADGWLDLASVNGHVDDFRPAIPLRMPAQLLAGGPRGKFTDVSARAGPAWLVPRLGRGLAAGDLDNDGRVDVLLLGQDEPLAYLHNRTERGGRWVTLRLEGTRANRDAVGARVRVTTAGGRVRTAWRVGGGSYQSASDGRIHVGLGPSEAIEQVEVAWPGGEGERFEGIAVDRGWRLRQGSGRAEPLAGFGPGLKPPATGRGGP